MAQQQGALGGGGDGRVRGYSSVGERGQNRAGQLYDRSGRPVRTVNGNVVAPYDGTYYDANRQPLGNAPQPYLDVNGNIAGYRPGGQQPIYDANGNLVGYRYVGNQQPIYDANGNIVGYSPTNQSGGQVPIYDANGNVVGYRGGTNPRYDANGNPYYPGAGYYPAAQGRVLNVGPVNIRY